MSAPAVPSSSPPERDGRINVRVPIELSRQVKAAAALVGQSIEEWVEHAMRAALPADWRP